MKKHYSEAYFRKVIVPIIYECESDQAYKAAQAIAGEGTIYLVGLVNIPEGEPLSAAAVQARRVRSFLKEMAKNRSIRISERVRVSYRPWDELLKIIREVDPDLLVLQWPCHFESLKIDPQIDLVNPPCDIAVVSGQISDRIENVLVSIRGGPYAELALRLSLSIGRNTQASVTSLHLIPADSSAPEDAAFRGIEQVLSNLPEVTREVVSTNQPVDAILSASTRHDLVIMGASGRRNQDQCWIGPMAERILNQSRAGVIIVKTKRPLPKDLDNEMVGQKAISVLVDKWFAENTYHADEFEDLNYLLSLKQKQGVTVSLALPALNEEKTVGNVIQTIKTTLMDDIPLLDEVVLIDSDSGDRTREIACNLGVPVYIHQQILPRYQPRDGKGEALWKSLLVTRGDIVIWIDTDIVNIHPSFVYGLLGPLLQRPSVQFVKGFYRRPLKVGDKIQAGGGGRVTELTARPLLNLFYPEISGIIQPLSGEYGGRRSALEQLRFYSGYGVEIGLLIDIFEMFGLSAIAQVDLQERIHHNQSLESLSKMSFAIIQAVIHKLERRYGSSVLEDVNRTMKLIRYEPGRFFLEVVEIAERERPPMIEVPEYRDARIYWHV